MQILKQGAIVAGGIAVGQLAQLLATPLLARIYSPADFGIYAAFVSFGTVLAITACFRYELVILVVPDDQLQPLSAVAIAGAVTSGVLAVIAVSISSFVNGAFHEQTLSHLVWPLPVAAVAIGLTQLGVNSALRAGRFWRMSVVRVVQPAVFICVALAGAGLVEGHLLGLIAASVVGLAGVVSIGRTWRVGTIWAAAKRYREYPLFSLPAAALNATALALPVLIITSAYGPSAAGNYSQVQRLIAAPLLLAGIVVGQIFFKHCGELVRSGRPVGQSLVRTASWFAVGGVLLWLFALGWGGPLLRWLLGESWRTDTFFVVVVLTPIVFRSIVSPVSSVFIAVGRMRLGMVWQVVYFLANLIVLFLASHLLNFDQFLFVFAANEAWLYGLYLFLANRAATEFGHPPQMRVMSRA